MPTPAAIARLSLVTPLRKSAVLLLLAALAAPARADGPDHANLDYLKDVLHETGAVVSSPLRWERSDWYEAGAVVGAGFGLYAGVDIWAQHAALRSQSGVADGFATAGRVFGDGLYVVPALGALYLAGEGAHDRRLRRASLDAFESFAISGLILTGTKALAGRNRPYSADRGDWDGPSLSNKQYSFPSGHSAAAFSVATTFATEYGDVPGVAPAAYALATLTALSRVYNNQHWASDVFIGGALGYFTAKTVARAHAGKDGRWTFSAYPLERGGGGAVAWRY
jgi:membrane-associated phospholipid phosphatase